MHPNSMSNMKAMSEKYLDKNAVLEILDMGSYNVNGIYRPIFENPTWKYVGADMSKGPNVDIVITSEFNWMELPQEHYDVFVCGQVLEHVRNPFKFGVCMNKVCKPSAIALVIAPWQIGIHRYPLDCWRICPDGMEYLMEQSGFEKLECYQAGNDTVYVGRKAGAPE